MGNVKGKRYGLRQCVKCYLWKALSRFHKDRSRKDGFRSACIECRSIDSKAYYAKAERKTYVTAYATQHKANRRRNTLKYMYGLSTENYEQLLFKQDGKCAICKQPETRKNSGFLCVDHDHLTGKIRGLLCFNCNTGIGKLNDNVDLLKNAITYLEYPW